MNQLLSAPIWLYYYCYHATATATSLLCPLKVAEFTVRMCVTC